ncbi:MAG: tetratricopeptide repeat protein, partial [Mesorhizobium sp.]
MPLLPRRQPVGLPAMVQDFLPAAGESAPETLQRGIDLQRRKRFREAEFCYQTVLRRQPKNAMALNLMGTLAIEAQRIETAIDFMKRAVKLEPGNAIFRNNLGNAYNLVGNIEQARKQLKKAIELDGRLVEALCNLGKSYRSQLEGDIAEGFYRRALAVDGQSLTALVGMGELLTDMGRQAEAVECFGR